MMNRSYFSRMDWRFILCGLIFLLTPFLGFSVERGMCPTWFREFGLNMESLSIHPEVAEFLRGFKFQLYDRALIGDQFRIFFKNKTLPRPGQSIEDAIDLEQLSHRLHVFQKEGRGSKNKRSYLLNLAIGQDEQMSFSHVLQLYPPFRDRELFYFDTEGNKELPRIGTHIYRSLYPRLGTRVLYEPTIDLIHPNDLYRTPNARAQVLDRGQRDDTPRSLTLPLPPGKEPQVNLTGNSLEKSQSTVQDTIQKKIALSKSIAETAADQLRSKRTVEVDRKLQNRAQQQLKEVRDLQRSILNREQISEEGFKDQLDAIRQIPHSPDSEESFMNSRSANLYAQEARDGHIRTVQEALLLLPKLKTSYEQLDATFKRIQVAQQKLSRAKDPLEIQTLEATLLKENEALEKLAEDLTHAREELGEVLARSEDKRNTVKKAHQELEASEQATLNPDPDVRQNLKNVGTLLQQEVIAGVQQEATLKKEFDRISTLQKDADSAIAGNLAVITQKRAVLSRGSIDQMARKLIEVKRGKTKFKWANLFPTRVKKQADPEPPRDLIELLDAFPEEMNALGQAPTPFGKFLKNVVEHEEDVRQRIALVHDLVNKKSFFVVSEYEKMDDVLAGVDPESLVAFEWPKRKKGLTTFGLKYLDKIKTNHLPEKRALWQVEKFDSIGKDPKYIVFEYSDLKGARKEIAAPIRLSQPHPDLLAHLKPGSNPYFKKLLAADPVLLENKEIVSHSVDDIDTDPALSLQDQIRLIEGGDPRSLMFFAQEEKSQLLHASEKLRRSTEKTERNLSNLKASGVQLDLSSFEFLTKIHQDLSKDTGALESKRARMQEAYDQLVKASHSGSEPRFQDEKRQLQTFLERIDAQIFTTKTLLQDLELLQTGVLESDPVYVRRR